MPRHATPICRRPRSASALPVDDELEHLHRGDLVFWKGHVGIMRDPRMLLHANGHHMLVASETLAEARARILQKGAGEITIDQTALAGSLSNVWRSKASRQKRGEFDALVHAVRPGAVNDGIFRREFRNALAAGSARPNSAVAIRDDENIGYLPAARGDHRGDRARLGATSGRISGVFDIGAGENLPSGVRDGRADSEMRIRRIGIFARRKRRSEEFVERSFLRVYLRESWS